MAEEIVLAGTISPAIGRHGNERSAMSDPRFPGVPTGPLNAGGKVGWWRAGEDGSSLHVEETGLVWGDLCAEAFELAIELIVSEFQAAWGRKPLKKEITSGLLFSLGIYDDKMQEKRP